MSRGMTTRGFLGLITMLLLAAGPYACSGTEASCVDLCEEGQERSCTSIKGDCSQFCDALFSVEDESGCVEEREAYHDCLESGDTCNNTCDGLENDLSSCVGTYCLTNSGTPECQTLINSF